MSNYELYYWSVPFRGQFVRAVLAFAGQEWSEGGDAGIEKFLEGAIRKMPIPFMGPPVLVDKGAGVAMSQMPAIILYLGETLNLLPRSAAAKALTIKVVNDANDVKACRDGGTPFSERWRRWPSRRCRSCRATLPPDRRLQRASGRGGRRHDRPSAGFR